MPVEEAARRLDEIEREEPGPYLAARIALARAWLAQFEGRFPEGREFAARAIDGYQTLGMTLQAAGSRQSLAEIEIAAGNLAAARGRSCWRRTRSRPQLVSAPTDRRSRTYWRTSRRSVAIAPPRQPAIELSDELTAPEDVINYAMTHAVRGRLALADRDSAAAEQWARSAVRYAFSTDFPQSHATAKLELARVLANVGRSDEATTEARAALELFAAKGDRQGSDEAPALLDELDKHG